MKSYEANVIHNKQNVGIKKTFFRYPKTMYMKLYMKIEM